MSSSTASRSVSISIRASAEAPAESCEPGTSTADGCCVLGAGLIDVVEAEHLALRLKALSDPTRLQLLSHVAVRGCGDVCACDLAEPLGISQPTVSHHMKKLVEAGLLTREQKGRWAHYSVVPSAFAELRTFLDLR
ncbi:MAG: ArsR/SmtB family transcription factor [Brachybacterium sp.]|uniref:ArsR/SmtB family transcription factor n=1 Tax=unclassified Brachybacterium TaxID=2623841 RepID=UPI003F8E2E29